MASREHLKTIVRGAYQIQKIRIQTGNRMLAAFRTRDGKFNPKDFMEDLQYSYEKIAKGGLPTKKAFKPRAMIHTYTDLVMIDQYMSLVKSEHEYFNKIDKILSEFPVYTGFLSKTKGVGPAIAGVIISEIDISKAKYPSSLFRLAGLDVAKDGRGRGKFKEHLIDVEYTTKDGKLATKKSITFNPFLKTKLIAVLGKSLMVHNKKYKQIYDEYKQRLINHELHKTKTAGHLHNMAIRRMVKLFLCELYNKWRAIENLEVFPPYHVAKLGLSDHK